MYFLSLALIVVFTAVDQIIKILVDKHIALNEVINVIKFGNTKIFSLTHIRNTGAAWSMMSGKTWFLICLPVVVCVFALIYMYKIRKTKKLEMFSISLFVAGGIGNLIDRIRLHEVIDTYGPAIKDIIHEQGGNAIMSAIHFGLDVDVTEDADGNHRVIIKFDGKLLPYAKKGQYPW